MEFNKKKNIKSALIISAILLFTAYLFLFFSEQYMLYSLFLFLLILLIYSIYTFTDFMLVILLFGIYFQDSPIEVLSVAIPIITIILLILFPLIWSIKRNNLPIVKIKLKYFNFAGKYLLFFLFMFFLTALASEDPIYTLKRGLPFPLIILFLTTINDYLKQKKKIYKFTRCLIFLITFFAIYGILQWLVVRKHIFFFLNPYIVPVNWQNVHLKVGWKTSDLAQFKSCAIFFHQNIFGSVLSSVAPLILSFFFFHKRKKHKIIFGISFLIASIALILTNSRGSLLAYMIGCGITLLLIRPRHLWKIIFLGTSAVAAFIISKLEKILFYMRLSSGLSGRRQIWAYCLELIQRHPFFGIGFLNIGKEFYSRFGPAYIIDMQLFFDKIQYEKNKISFDSFHAHNLYLNLAVEMGIFTAVAAFLFYITLIYKLFLFIKNEHLAEWEKMILYPMLGIFCGSFVYSFFDTNTLNYILLQIIITLAIERAYIVRLIEKSFNQETLFNK